MRPNALMMTAFLALLSCGVIAADAPPVPSAPEGRAGRPGGAYARPVPIGPNDSTEIARALSGKVMLVANAPRDVEAATVDFLVDEKPVGSVSKRPFVLEFDTSSIPDGDHSFKSTARDTDGKEIWNASAKVRVNNSSSASGAPPEDRALEDRRTPRPDRGGVPRPQGPVDATGPEIARPTTDIDDRDASSPPSSSGTAVPALDKTYTSRAYGFSISYPGAWIVRDETANKPKEPGGFWIVLGPDPIESAPMVVNIHRRRLNPGADADTFARYNSYVNSWERKTLLGSPAFTTTSGTPQARDVVHRAILIASGSAWMFNLTDRSGGPAAQSAELFSKMLNSFRPSVK